MNQRIRLAAVAVLTIGTGCYHATVDTGRTPSGQTVERRWAHGFVYGLVPPSTVETAAACPNGVARVETQLSFLNQLATFLTFGIYTPMNITVQCAAAGSALLSDASGETASVISLPAEASMQQFSHALNQAVERSASAGGPVYVRFDSLK